MKTRIATLTLLLGLFFTSAGFAAKPVPATKLASLAVTKLLTNELNYPNYASENNIEFYVLASINVQEDGSLDVVIANCKSCEMKEEVIKAIESIQSEDLVKHAGHTINVKVNFTLID